ncbi:Cyclase-like protein 2 [Linum perenne]
MKMSSSSVPSTSSLFFTLCFQPATTVHTVVYLPIAMSSPLIFLLLILTSTFLAAAASNDAAYPTIPGTTDTSSFSTASSDDLIPVRREVYGDGKIFDITHRYTVDLPVWESDDGLGQFLWLPKSMKNGSQANNSEMKLPAHTGTHVDAPGHVFHHYFDAGFDVDTLDLEVLNGAALLVDVPRDTNLTAEAMKSLNIPKGVSRVIFRTLNTDRKLMFKKQFDSSYVGFTKDGAQWLVDNTDIKFVGVDYLSVAAWTDLIPAHHVFLHGKEIILVEALKLDGLQPGLYSVHCLPLRLFHAEGSPIRCILMK